MRVAIDKNGDGVIDNIVEAESVAAAAELFPADTVMDAVAEGVRIGWVKQGDGSYAAPVLPEPDPVYRKLDSAALIGHLEAAGGMTPADIVACSKEATLEYFWLLMRTAPHTSRDNPKLPAALDQLEALGYLDAAGKQAVLDAWPVE